MDARIEHRYASTEQFTSDLRAFLSHEPVVAYPGGVLRRTALFAQRRPRVAASLVALLLTVATTVAVVAITLGAKNARINSASAQVTQTQAFLLRMFERAYEGNRLPAGRALQCACCTSTQGPRTSRVPTRTPRSLERHPRSHPCLPRPLGPSCCTCEQCPSLGERELQ